MRSLLEEILRQTLLFVVGFYRSLLTAHFGGCCRFFPSCSEYANQAIHAQGPLRAIPTISRRLLKCRPWGPSGYDPIEKGSDL